jgi:opacity protein-like surface antigen
MRKLLIIVLGLCYWFSAYSQQETADFGLFLGGGTPFGDYTKTNRLQSVDLNYGGFYRYNFNSRISVRLNALFGNIKGSGEINSIVVPPFRTNVTELSSLLEINYLDFLLGTDNRRFSPYVFAGVGLAYYSYSLGTERIAVATPSLPMGLGVKFALTKRWGVGAEVSMHKLFDDWLDNINDPYRQPGMTGANTFWHNNDWIGYGGIKVWYKFYSGKRDCPAYDSIN